MFLTHLFLTGGEGIRIGFLQEVTSVLKPQGPVGLSQLNGGRGRVGKYGLPTHWEHQIQRPGSESQHDFVTSNHSLEQENKVGVGSECKHPCCPCQENGLCPDSSRALWVSASSGLWFG